MARKLYSTDALPDEDPPSHREGRRERVQHEEALLELAGQLTRLAPLDFERLGLPETVGDAVELARSRRSGKPRNRALRNVRAALRGLDRELIAETSGRLA